MPLIITLLMAALLVPLTPLGAEVSAVLESEARLEVDLGGKPLPKWRNGALVVREMVGTTAARIRSLDSQGKVISDVPFKLPEATYLLLKDASRRTDGTIALCGSAADSAGRPASFVAWISPDGQDVRVLRTYPYVPYQVAFAADGSLWTVGIVHSDPTAPVFRRFQDSGEMNGSFVSLADIEGDPAVLVQDQNIFSAVSDRIVWYSARSGQYIELSASGVTKQVSGLLFPAGEREMGYAITDRGDVFFTSLRSSEWLMYRLDAVRREWIPIRRSTLEGDGRRNVIQLCGAEGEQLIAWTNTSQIRFWTIH
ncbi:MAG: hypothetical protein ACK5AZ_25955 [Bryobacteraceae bacterium]